MKSSRSAIIQDWEHLSNVLRQGMTQQCGIGLGTARHGIIKRSMSAIFQDWQHLSRVIRQGIRQECFKIVNISAMQ